MGERASRNSEWPFVAFVALVLMAGWWPEFTDGIVKIVRALRGAR